MKYIYLAAVLLAAPLVAQPPIAGNGGGRTTNSGATDPATCNPTVSSLFRNTTSNLTKFCSAANTWTAIGSGGGSGTIDLTTNVLKGDGAGAGVAATPGTDFVLPGGALGTPSSGTLTNATGLPISTGVSGLGTAVGTFLGTPSSANLAAALTNETGTGAAVFATSPTLVTPDLGTPSAGVLTNATGLPVSSGVSGLGTGVANFLATPTSANLAAALTNETGTGAAVFATSPTLVTPSLGTPAAINLGNATNLPSAALPDPGASAKGGIQSKDCTGTGHVLSLNTDSTVTCSADAGGGSATSVFTGSTASAPSFSATPTFSLADVSSKSPVRFEPGVMTAAVTSVTFTNKSAGAKFSIVWKQDGTGGRTLTHGASASGTCETAMSTAANASTTQFYEVGQDGTTVTGVGCIGSANDAVRNSEESAPGTPAASTGVCWFDSTNHIFSCKNNNSSTVSSAAVPLTCTNQVFSGLSAAGVFTCHTIVSADLSITTTTCTNQLVSAISAGAVGTCHTIVSADMNITTTTCTNQLVSAISAGAVGTCHTIVSNDLNITPTTCTAPQVVTAISAGGVGTCTAPLLTQNSQSAAYTTVLGDAGKQIYHPGADTTARTWTIDSNANVAYSIGTCITFINDTSAGVVTIAITSDTMILAGAGTTGSRTLAASGIATACKMTSTRWIVNGTGLT